jgi:hypothetical protein
VHNRDIEQAITQAHNQEKTTMFTVYGFTISTKAQCQSVMMVALLKGNDEVVQQCRAIMPKLPD